ncbi:23S ribosomal RNA methyltransferase Erm [Desertihabitans aurantiacus]|uniref:23S ribosomal RNA methyltransferase Erm n=1 Tax=Desertihabitans aurantiacus TaxID=2282477 RepID=UPI000DF72365|nr:23S ribosomal RNA methyltransferase Erm [Desertihabitans aurantiacus]
MGETRARKLPRSSQGGRHELGQNFLTHAPTIAFITELVHRTDGPVLEIGAGDGALTRAVAGLRRDLTALEIDEHRAQRLTRELHGVRVLRADALRHPLEAEVVVGNIPFHLTTPILRRLLNAAAWKHAILLTQWEVARKRAGVGGSTMMTAQAVPWFEFELHQRVPASAFSPRPSVDGGILAIRRRERPLVPWRDRRRYESFVYSVFTGRGRGLRQILQRETSASPAQVQRALRLAGVHPERLPRDLDATAWASLWSMLGGRRHPPRQDQRSPSSRAIER